MAIGDDVPTLIRKIADVDTAIHELNTTGATTKLQHGGKVLETTNPTMGSLMAYRSMLVDEANKLGAGLPGGRAKARRPRWV